MLEVITYPDKRLKQISNPIEHFDAELHQLLDAMYDTMIDSKGIGLAAIQVAEPLCALIINIPDEDDQQTRENTLEIINPKIVASEGVTLYQEGCLSVPGFYEDIERYEQVSVSFQNRYGEEKELTATGLLSIALQHEIDHLLGKLFIEKLSYARRKKFEKEYKKTQKDKALK